MDNALTSIIFENVSFSYSAGVPLFQKLSLRLKGPTANNHGHVIAIMGPSGSGKTTLLRLVCDVESPKQGSIALTPAGASVSYLQQQPVLFEHLSRIANARYFADVQYVRGSFDEVTFKRLSKRLKLTSVLESRLGTDEMSGGERQRLALLRALSIKPKILLLDEPCTGLDTDVKLEFLHMLREVVDEFDLLALYVTHHGDEADLVADELLYLSHGAAATGAEARLAPIQSALESPPSPEAALGSMSSGGNMMKCEVKESCIVTSPSGIVLGRLSEQCTAFKGECTVVFRPETVKWLDGVDQGVRLVGQSALYSFAAAPDSEKLIGPRSSFNPRAFCLCGDAIIFGQGAASGARVKLVS